MKIFTIILVLFCSIAGYAQNKFKEGYIITLKKDTVKGFIKEVSDVEAISTCYFKPTENDSVEMYRIGFLNEYGFIRSKKKYVNHQIEFKNGATHRGYFEHLAAGKVNLYYYINEIDGNVSYYIFEKEGEKPVYVTNKWTEIQKTERENGIYYKKPLLQLFKDCPSLTEDINSALFKKSSFTKIAKKYNNLMKTIDNINFNLEES